MAAQESQNKKAPIRYRLAIAAYQVALSALMPLIWRYFRRRALKDPAYSENWPERRGEHSHETCDVWVHAVSLGELRSAEVTIRLLLEAGVSLAITHATPAGRRASFDLFEKDIAAGRVQVGYAPLDKIAYWRNFFRAKRPRVGLVFEIEFWPGMVEAARTENVDLWFVNSQVPAKTYPRARRSKTLLGAHPVGRATGVLAKSERMAERFRALGSPDTRVIGETRFDTPPPKAQIDAADLVVSQLSGRGVFTFASVVKGEETVYQETAKDLLKSNPKPLIVWVPRASEQFEPTFVHLEAAGLNVGRRSDHFDEELEQSSSLEQVDVLVGDSYGEMFFYLGMADAVSVGGGFLESGAHNVIEPLAVGKPVATGPNIWTIEYPGQEAIDAGVLRICRSGDRLAETLRDLADNGNAGALSFHEANSGASGAIAALTLDALSNRQDRNI